MVDKRRDPSADKVGDFGDFGELKVSDEEAALARQFADALETPPPFDEDAASDESAALESDLAAVGLVKTGDEFELNAARQAAMKAELQAQFERHQERTQRATSDEQKSRWWRWLSVPPFATAGAGAFLVYMVWASTATDSAPQTMAAAEEGTPSSEMLASEPKPAPGAVAALGRARAMAGPSPRLLRAQADALAAATARNESGNARRALDSEVADYRWQMIASLEVSYR